MHSFVGWDKPMPLNFASEGFNQLLMAPSLP
ncbi:hypothetical protein GKJPGBOP_04454 [Streptomyces paromomycinus]|uniref:Uncharacterized protein n=1 Tax=Streptomyces paromomycinus TaxID=92743 RepID=A0A401W5V8_STREY|nr:hypothetical protein GKJPGBOP_04454 [Streptomyces paromomycinus]